MQIISWQFLVFFITVLVVYYLLPRRAQNIWLLTASFFFLVTWNVFSAVVLIISILINYIIAQRIWKGENKKRQWVWLGIVLNVATLFFFRFETSGYLERGIRAFFQLADPSNSFEIRILFPVGFSYYCLQAISYLVDISQKQCEPSTNIINFGLYMAYFPRLLSGPIERARTFLPSLEADRVVDNERLARGFSRIMLGLVRKVIIAGVLTAYVPKDLFSSPLDYSSFDLIIRIFLYAFWIYNDFAGYTNIARGMSDLFGIDLSPNFDTPFFARSFTDFWNRWHISLSHWLRDYIFFPVSRFMLRRKINPRSIVYLTIPPLITMLVSGLWHNFGAFMLFWGVLHGLFQSIEKLSSRGKPILVWAEQKAWKKLFAVISVFVVVTATWLPFASGSLSRVGGYVGAIFTSPVPVQINTLWIIPLFGVVLSMYLDLLHYCKKDELAFRRWPGFVQSAALAAAIIGLTISFMGTQNALNSFVYQGF